ncbi:cellulose binding domain-containing protein [Streptomyces sp. NPDC046985]|uniref:cellulose binding domain-containing protein n=1 Tax=Streptomyces sp. NPDC046985 TaxID=3155377 RepID=UPI0034054A34
MPEQPSPQDAAEAALLSECWDPVLACADLCTAGSAVAGELAAEAFALGLREVRAADAGASRGRRTPRLPAIPLMLAAVRTTAASWESRGLGQRLDPDLRLWLNSEKADRYTGPPPLRPLALRGLRDLPETDAALLWLTEVEALPPSVTARRLGLDPATVSGELDQVRALFRDRCHRNHLDTPMDAECRSYARLLDAVTRSTPVAEAPEDLSRHLAGCVSCAEAAACLRLHGGGLPAALAGGVIGWGGLAYLERRRRAAEARLGPPGAADQESGDPRAAAGSDRARRVRGGLLAAAVALSALALTVSLMPFGGADDAAAHGDESPRQVADRDVASPTAAPPARRTPGTAAPSHSASRPPSRWPHPRATETAAGRGGGPEPQDVPSSTAGAGAPPSAPRPTPPPSPGTPPDCAVHYAVASQWPAGFQVSVTVTTAASLDDWQLAWSFRDGQRVGQTWDATSAQDGAYVTASAASYNRSVSAGGAVSFGFIGSWQGANTTPDRFSLNGRVCATR